MSLSEFHKFQALPDSVRARIWKFASVQAHDGPRVYHFKYEFEARQNYTVPMHMGKYSNKDLRGPILSFRPQLAEETKSQRALLMTSREARLCFLSMYRDRINFTRPRDRSIDGELCEYPTFSIQYALFIDAQTDIICLSGEELRSKYNPRVEPYFQPWTRRQGTGSSLNWPLWRDIKNIAIDVTNAQVTVHKSGNAMDSALFIYMDNLLFNGNSCAADTRLFAVNLGPIQYDAAGGPLHMTVDAAMPEYKSTMPECERIMPGSMALPQGTPRLSVNHMCMMLEEVEVMAMPSKWYRFGRYRPSRPSRLLVRSRDGQRLLAVQHVTVPVNRYEADAYDSDDTYYTDDIDEGSGP